MGISFDQALGVHAHTLNVRAERAKVLAGNLANVDTPGYQARDIDFSAAMADVESRLQRGQQVPDAQSHALQYRVPYNHSLDGNTVELGVEQAKFAQNSMDFETTLTFLNMKFKGLETAIQGH